MGKVIRFFFYGLIIASTVSLIILWRAPFSLQPRQFAPPELTTWKPVGARNVKNTNAIVGENEYFRTFHSDTHNSDEVLTIIAPVFEKAWSTELDMFIAEGPTLDADGNLYFSPISPKEDVVLVSLDGDTGERRWAIKGRDNGGGAPLILNDPDTDEQIIYHGSALKFYAVRTDGSIIWEAPTGLETYDVSKGGISKHNFGLNYHPKADALIGVIGQGTVFVLDRKTGARLLDKPFNLPGANTKPETDRRPAEFIVKRANKIMEDVFLPRSDGKGWFDIMLNAVSGGGTKVGNYFAIDVNTSRIFIAATSRDGDDGSLDSISEFGGIYALELVKGPENYELKIVAEQSFEGGSAATPALSPDGTRLYTADNFGNVLAYDRDLNELWRLDINNKAMASISVASDNNELYAITLYDIIKIIDKGDSASEAWRATLDIYPKRLGQKNLNLLTATVAPNGVAVQVGSGYVRRKTLPLPLTVGIGLLDRATGKMRYFLEGCEESIAATIIGHDGSIIVGHSPVRRAATYSVLGFKMKSITGGVTKFRPVRLDLLARDAVHAAIDRAANANQIKEKYPESAMADIKHITTLLHQALKALPIAVTDNNMTKENADKIEKAINHSLSGLELDSLNATVKTLNGIMKYLKI
ncbi:hypothetical protein [Desulfobacula sp.]